MKIVKITQAKIVESFISYDTSFLKVGDVVPIDIYIKRAKDYVIIIERGVELTQKLYNLLANQDSLYVVESEAKCLNNDAEYHELSCLTLLARIKRDKHDLKKMFKLLHRVNEQIFYKFFNDEKNQLELSCVDVIIESMLILIEKNDHCLRASMPLLENSYKIPAHSFNVTLYALHIGTQLKLNHTTLKQLGQAAFLQDIGKKAICSIVSKTCELSLEETELIKKHTQYSLDIVQENGITNSVILDAIRQHHERYDGSGYPDSLQKNEITI